MHSRIDGVGTCSSPGTSSCAVSDGAAEGSRARRRRASGSRRPRAADREPALVEVELRGVLGHPASRRRSSRRAPPEKDARREPVADHVPRTARCVREPAAARLAASKTARGPAAAEAVHEHRRVRPPVHPDDPQRNARPPRSARAATCSSGSASACISRPARPRSRGNPCGGRRPAAARSSRNAWRSRCRVMLRSAQRSDERSVLGVAGGHGGQRVQRGPEDPTPPRSPTPTTTRSAARNRATCGTRNSPRSSPRRWNLARRTGVAAPRSRVRSRRLERSTSYTAEIPIEDRLLDGTATQNVGQ